MIIHELSDKVKIMDHLEANEIAFLIALNASEESSINDLKQEFSCWSVDVSIVAELIRQQISEGLVLFMKRSLDEVSDCTKEQSRDIASKWSELDSDAIALFLTDEGWLRWENDGWGVSEVRAKYLIFFNPQRVP